MITMTVDDRQIRQTIDRLLQKTNNLRPAMEQIGEAIKLSVKLNFEQEGRPTRWKKSHRAASGGQTLSDRATLRNSFTYDADSQSVRVGTNVRYAAIHHFGGTIKAKNKRALNTPFGPRRSVTMPARPFLMIQQEDTTRIINILKRHLES